MINEITKEFKLKAIFINLLIYSTCFASEYKLIGSSLLEVTIFKLDVYELYYYEKKDNKSIHQKLTLKYLRDVKKKYSVMGWSQGLEKYIKTPDEQKALKWFLSTTNDIKEGDQMDIIKSNNKVQIFKNGKIINESNDPDVFKLSHAVWIGKYPISEKIKEQLLGGKRNSL